MQPDERRSLFVQIAYPILALGLVVGLWAAAVEVFQIPRYVMPSPGQVAEHIALDWQTLIEGFVITFTEFLLGFVLGAGGGFLFAVAMDASKTVRGVLYPVLIASQAVPIVAISAALTIWLGFGLAPKLVIVALVVFFPVVVNVLDGLASVDRDVLNLVRSMGASKLATFRHVKLPATYSPLFSALKLSATFSVTGAVIAEWTASTSGGLGAYLLQANSRLNTAGTFAAIAFLALLGVVSFLLVVLAEKGLTPWKSASVARRWSRSFWRDEG
ncbi:MULTISPECIES: ABC transporter permease [unclassified Aureimonas]|uniref:ABC transporter permease n=1 Tax=unclassified Aureimonas TaxID=2615206 RepID=UPI00070070B8|nr:MULTISPECIES: ABC transporter permease [unclassified Aureimonas]KQT60638.1 ABC transporter permease [Aureimonas sp. Leaf460]KQT68767.1 ABC transporter permease [Aureimonas sp. Leaf427]